MHTERLKYLLLKAEHGLLSEPESAELSAWYAAFPEGNPPSATLSAPELEKMERRIWDGVLRQLPQQTPRRRLMYRIAGAAAAAAVLLFAAWWLIRPEVPQAGTIVFATKAGERRQIVLPDSTKVWLSPASTLSYAPFTAGNREVQLDGEAFFDVVTRQDAPFSIRSGACRTVVLGTSFNVQAYAADSMATVTVLTGKVKVTAGREDRGVAIGALQRAKLRAGSDSIYTESAPDAADLLATRAGTILFNGTPLREAVRVLERELNISITIPAAIAECEYYSRFEAGVKPEAVLEEICMTLHATFQQTQPSVFVVTGGRCMP